MTDVDGVPYREIAFDKDGDHAPVDRLCPPGTTDLLVLSHGWKNDALDARALYRAIVTAMLAAGGRASGRSFAVVGVRWPAFRFNPDMTLLPDDHPPGQGAAAGLGDTDFTRAELEAIAQGIGRDLEVADPEAFAREAAAAAGGGGAADRFVATLRAAASPPELHPEAGREHEALLNAPGRELVETFRTPPPLAPTAAAGQAAGRAAASFIDDARSALGRWRSGGRAAVATVLNQLTYYEMKARAGTVGRALATLLDAQVLDGVRVHLVGHSFGARLVSAAAAGLARLHAASMTLLQGAFSHNGFGQAIGRRGIDGAFRQVVEQRRVTGTIAVTHTHNDTAVGFFYALASTLSREIAAGLELSDVIGGPADLHGGIGANGALAMKQDEAVAVTARTGELLALEAGKVTNILADAIITNHNDVANAEAGRIVWAAVRAGQ